MFRLAPAAAALFLVAVAAYAGSLYATRSVFAHNDLTSWYEFTTTGNWQ